MYLESLAPAPGFSFTGNAWVDLKDARSLVEKEKLRWVWGEQGCGRCEGCDGEAFGSEKYGVEHKARLE